MVIDVKGHGQRSNLIIVREILTVSDVFSEIWSILFLFVCFSLFLFLDAEVILRKLGQCLAVIMDL